MTDLSQYKAWPGKEHVSATAWNAILEAIKSGIEDSRAGDIRTHIGATGGSNYDAYPRPSDNPALYPIRLYCGQWRPTAGSDFAPASWECVLDSENAPPVVVYAAIVGDARGRYLPYGSPVVVLETCGQYWCFPIEPLIYHFRLDECLYPGGSASAYLLVNGEDVPGSITVHDKIGVFSGSQGDKGTCFWDYADKTYSIIFIDGTPCQSSTSDSSVSESDISEPSISEPSTSESSVSEPSASDSSASEPSTSGSSISESSISDSGVSDSSASVSIASDSSTSESSVSESSTSESVPSESWPSESSKSTAIVPASFSRTGYAALFVLEAPEVRFDDVIVAEVHLRDTEIPIDRRFIEVCQANTIEVCGVSCDVPVAVGASVKDGKVHVRFSTKSARKRARVVIRLTGIRKGFYGQRFPSRTKNQFEANERFINSAYPAE